MLSSIEGSFIVPQSDTQARPPLHTTIWNEEAHEHTQHTSTQRNFMLLYTLSLSYIACMVLRPLYTFPQKWEGKRIPKVWVQKACRVTRLVLVMCIAWGFLLWGEWEFLEVQFHGDELFGWLLLWCMYTIICLIMLEFLGTFVERIEENANIKVTSNKLQWIKDWSTLVAMGMSLTCAWCWEHTFDMSLDVFGALYNFGHGGLVPKLVLSVLIPSYMIPIYSKYIKTVTSNYESLRSENGVSMSGPVRPQAALSSSSTIT